MEEYVGNTYVMRSWICKTQFVIVYVYMGRIVNKDTFLHVEVIGGFGIVDEARVVSPSQLFKEYPTDS